MTDTTVKKVVSEHSPTGSMGQKYLVSGVLKYAKTGWASATSATHSAQPRKRLGRYFPAYSPPGP